ncbi:hypothetical protein [Pseudorhodoferax sp. Leaf267]|uniref:hypothetical protein n=1 Tax=Pseudorhodoferax sp. Leaf267 TaxID=1736316 RepID=UPI0006F91F3A|nr:hypothetical protein [Pseudorhodoferax sp. Leaf267]KQP20554.1 hypothetical protein ASF43_27405 [Pseudorhodoferax sp. Leaf267]
MTADRVCKLVFDAGMTMHADGAELVLKPAAKLTAELRALLVKHKADLLDFIRQADMLTAETLARAMAVCDRHDDSDQAREDMRREVIETPAHLKADLLEHFRQAYPGPGA